MKPLSRAVRIEDTFGQCARLAPEHAVGREHVPVAEMRQRRRTVGGPRYLCEFRNRRATDLHRPYPE